MDTAHKVSEIGAPVGTIPSPASAFPRPSTTTCPVTDCCPGIRLRRQVHRRVHAPKPPSTWQSMARTSTKVFVLEVMGRHAGWMAAAGGLAWPMTEAGDAPHIILFPRNHLRQGTKFLAKVKQLGREVTATACGGGPRGVRDSLTASFWPRAAPRTLSATPSSAASAPLVAQMTHEALGYKFHWAVADYLQRSARHIASQGRRRAGLCGGQGRRGTCGARAETP